MTCRCRAYTKGEVFSMIRRNKITKREAIILISDFMGLTRKQAEKIYNKDYEDKEVAYEDSD